MTGNDGNKDIEQTDDRVIINNLPPKCTILTVPTKPFKLTKAGDGCHLYIPKKDMEAFGIEIGDYIDVVLTPATK